MASLPLYLSEVGSAGASVDRSGRLEGKQSNTGFSAVGHQVLDEIVLIGLCAANSEAGGLSDGERIRVHDIDLAAHDL